MLIATFFYFFLKEMEGKRDLLSPSKRYLRSDNERHPRVPDRIENIDESRSMSTRTQQNVSGQGRPNDQHIRSHDRELRFLPSSVLMHEPRSQFLPTAPDLELDEIWSDHSRSPVQQREIIAEVHRSFVPAGSSEDLPPSYEDCCVLARRSSNL